MPQYYGYGNDYNQQPARRPSVRRPAQQPVRQPQRNRRGGGCLLAVFVMLLVLVALAAVLVFARPLLSQLGLLNYLPESIVELIPVQSDEGVLAQQDHERLHAKLTGRYVYDHLNAADQENYRTMYDALESREKRRYAYTDADELSRIRNCIIADHPELFYVSGVNAHTVTTHSIMGDSSTTMVEGIYRYDADETKKLRRQLDEAAVACLDRLPSGADDYQKAKFLYDFIVKNVEYDWAAYEAATGNDAESAGQTAVDALVNGKAVCAGYSSSFQYLAQKLGLQCVYVTGTARGEAHAWNIVELDGAFYHVDATWGDPQFVQEDGGTADVDHVNYDYLCLTTEDVLKDHTIDTWSVVPECTSTADNYYIREGRYFDEADTEVIGDLVKSAASHGDPSVQFRCASRDTYDSLYYSLFDLGAIYPYLPSDTCWYTSNDNLCSIAIIFAE